MKELDMQADSRGTPSPQLLQDTLKRIIRRVTDQVAADLLAERGTVPQATSLNHPPHRRVTRMSGYTRGS